MTWIFHEIHPMLFLPCMANLYILLYVFYKYFNRTSFTFLIVPLHFSSTYSGVHVNCYFGMKYRYNELKGSITILLWPEVPQGPDSVTERCRRRAMKITTSVPTSTYLDTVNHRIHFQIHILYS